MPTFTQTQMLEQSYGFIALLSRMSQVNSSHGLYSATLRRLHRIMKSTQAYSHVTSVLALVARFAHSPTVAQRQGVLVVPLAL